MTSKKQKRNRRGGVSVGVRNKILRLRWQHLGRQHQLSLRIPDTAENRQLAAEKAAQIETDIIHGNYDESLERYEIIAHQARWQQSNLSTAELFDAFTAFKAKDGISGQTLSTKYRALRSNIVRFGRQVLTPNDAYELVELLRDRQSPRTANQNLVLLKGFGRWLCEQKHFRQNLFADIRPIKGAAAVRVQDRSPFTLDELAQFMMTMLLHPTACHYYGFTLTLFSLGLRPSECIGLRWQHLDLVRRLVTIRESLSRADDGRTSGKARQRKGTKTENVRVLKMGDRLHQLFVTIKPASAHPDDLIFTAASGGPIDDHNYRERYWKVVCKAADISYRPPYVTRHTLISHGLEYGGWTEKQAAAVAGHTTTRMIQETYSHLMEMPEMPDVH
ncbi:site-specific integrase [cf. Phormidesmis sp. LEGE 11477]|uniref:site-specific integrase n=1 Tax=cf. Phormidesmis sp. LEGE 11477 TaxID=1828680 RepID=UPI00188034D6|nr:site-specific integrase [cf. Phormidesmis sp. LEGE 11477]MBE9063304.1 tyrosine-type recombinase/integrase [cf. Phormidesmis sp. LEGE 11477]